MAHSLPPTPLCPQDVISAEFIHRLKSLLQRAYSLQEEFEGVLCVSEPSSHSSSPGKTTRRRHSSRQRKKHAGQRGSLLQPVFISVPSTTADKMAEDVELEDACLRDSISIASTDSFVSAAEVSVQSQSPNRTCEGGATIDS